MDDRGATAIEYGLIAGLVALGLIGSLVTTRGSLSAIFGAASSQMGSASGGAAASGLQFNPANPRSAVWSAKTVASGPTHYDYGTRQLWVTKFTDGSEVDYESYSSGQTNVTTFDPITLQSTQISLDGTGAAVRGIVFVWSDATRANQTYEYYSATFANNVPTAESAGGCSAGSCTLPVTTLTASFRQSMANAYNDIALWAANTPR